MMSLTSSTPLRNDKFIMAMVMAAGLGWAGCELAYRVQDLGWLRYRSAELGEVQKVIAPNAPTPVILNKAKELKSKAKDCDAD